MVSNHREKIQVICSLVIFIAIAVMSLGGASYSSAHANESLSARALPTGPDEEYFSDQIIVGFGTEIRGATEVDLYKSLGASVVYTGRYAGLEVPQVPKGKNRG
jgi:hypothetical protein